MRKQFLLELMQAQAFGSLYQTTYLRDARQVLEPLQESVFETVPLSAPQATAILTPKLVSEDPEEAKRSPLAGRMLNANNIPESVRRQLGW